MPGKVEACPILGGHGVPMAKIQLIPKTCCEFPQPVYTYFEERPFRIALPANRPLGDSIPPNESDYDIELTRYARNKRLMR